MTRITNSITYRQETEGPLVLSRILQSLYCWATDFLIAYDDSLSVIGSSKGNCHQYIDKQKQVCEGLSSHSNAGSLQPRDRTASTYDDALSFKDMNRGVCGDRTFVVAGIPVKGGSLMCFRSFN